MFYFLEAGASIFCFLFYNSGYGLLLIVMNWLRRGVFSHLFFTRLSEKIPRPSNMSMEGKHESWFVNVIRTVVI